MSATILALFIKPFKDHCELKITEDTYLRMYLKSMEVIFKEKIYLYHNLVRERPYIKMHYKP